MADFIKNINKFRHKVDRKTNRVFQHACSNVSYSIAEKSPVSTGRLLGQWNPSAGSRARHSFQGGPSAWRKGQKNEAIASANRAKAMRDLSPRINSATESLDKQDNYYFTNHTDYARQAEYQGWQKTREYAMVTKASQEFRQMVDQLAIRYRDV